MIYNTFPRTRQAVYGFTFLFGGGLLAATLWRWNGRHEYSDLIIAFWDLGVAWGTIKILRGLERLELRRSEPDEAMELLFYAASVFPIAGYIPLFFHLGSR